MKSYHPSRVHPKSKVQVPTSGIPSIPGFRHNSTSFGIEQGVEDEPRVSSSGGRERTADRRDSEPLASETRSGARAEEAAGAEPAAPQASSTVGSSRRWRPRVRGTASMSMGGIYLHWSTMDTTSQTVGSQTNTTYTNDSIKHI